MSTDSNQARVFIIYLLVFIKHFQYCHTHPQTLGSLQVVVCTYTSLNGEHKIIPQVQMSGPAPTPVIF